MPSALLGAGGVAPKKTCFSMGRRELCAGPAAAVGWAVASMAPAPGGGSDALPAAERPRRRGPGEAGGGGVQPGRIPRRDGRSATLSSLGTHLRASTSPHARHQPAIVRRARHMPGRLLRPFVVASKAPMESVRMSRRRGVPSRRTAARTQIAKARASRTVMDSSRLQGMEK